MKEKMDFNSARLVWITPQAEQIIGDLARVSAPQNQGKDAARLVAYLIKHQHWSPFEMASMCLEIETTRDIARQILRHRSFSFQEFSQRYADAQELPRAPYRDTRMQDTKNRQNSLETQDMDLILDWEIRQEAVRETALAAYQWALGNGLAKEIARAVLPEGLTSTRLYASGTLRSWIHFCQLRMAHGTQRETQRIARAAWGILKEHCPMVVAAAEDAA